MSKMKEYLLANCDCIDVCGWTKEHTLIQEGKWWVCSNCGTIMWNPSEKEQIISFDCEVHGEQHWMR